MPLKFYNLIINKETHRTFLSLTSADGDGNRGDEIGLRDAMELFKELANEIDKRLKNQKSDTRSVSDTGQFYPHGYPDAILQE